MIRNENLKTLSWEHHDGLVVAFRLQQGIKRKVRLSDIVAYSIYVWENTLQHHFIREEKTINPNLENRPEGKVLVERMMAEHLIFNKLIRRIKSNAKGTDAIGKFAELLNKHIRFEERDLFPLLEKTATNKELTAIGIILGDSYHSTCNNWPIKFWEQPQNAVGLKA